MTRRRQFVTRGLGGAGGFGKFGKRSRPFKYGQAKNNAPQDGKKDSHATS
jgi:hypothetical protein